MKSKISMLTYNPALKTGLYMYVPGVDTAEYLILMEHLTCKIDVDSLQG